MIDDFMVFRIDLEGFAALVTKHEFHPVGHSEGFDCIPPRFLLFSAPFETKLHLKLHVCL